MNEIISICYIVYLDKSYSYNLWMLTWKFVETWPELPFLHLVCELDENQERNRNGQNSAIFFFRIIKISHEEHCNQNTW